MNFLLDSGRRTSKNGAMLLPKYDFVYAFLDVVDFHNWKSEKNEDCVTFVEHADFQPEHLTSQCIPIGGIEFCSEWYRQMGIRCILPLNIPDCLDSLVRRPIIRTNNLQWNGNRYFGKSMSEIKSDKNGWYMEYHERAPMLFTQEVENISSEMAFLCLQWSHLWNEMLYRKSTCCSGCKILQVGCRCNRRPKNSAGICVGFNGSGRWRHGHSGNA